MRRVSSRYRSLALPYTWHSIVIHASHASTSTEQPLYQEILDSSSGVQRWTKEVRLFYQSEDLNWSATEQCIQGLKALRVLKWQVHFEFTPKNLGEHIKAFHQTLQDTFPTVDLGVSWHLPRRIENGRLMTLPLYSNGLPVVLSSQILRSFQISIHAPRHSSEFEPCGLAIIREIMLKSPNLQVFDLHFLHREEEASSELDISDIAFCHLIVLPFDRLPPLKELRLTNYVWNDAHAARFASAMDWTELRRLDLRNCLHLSDRGLSRYNMVFFEAFCGKLPSLQYLRTGFFLFGPGHARRGYDILHRFLQQLSGLRELSLVGSLYHYRNLYQCEKTVLEMLLIHGSTIESIEYIGSNVPDNRTLWSVSALELIREQCPRFSSISLNIEDLGAYGQFGPRFILGNMKAQSTRLMADPVFLALAKIPQLKQLTIHTEMAEREILFPDQSSSIMAVKSLFTFIQLHRTGHPLEKLTIHSTSCTRIHDRARPYKSPTITFHCRRTVNTDCQGQFDVDIQHGDASAAQAEVGSGFSTRRRVIRL
ncbi:MAG: hypothetical protein MMC33_004750 [Icmadophila ericetorum]|nr:hypothetical protein [Icmadophila ericetorum]